MANTRPFLPALPDDLLLPHSGNINGSSIPSAGSTATELAVVNLLSRTCKAANKFFKPTLESKQLLTYVLQGKEADVLKTAKTNPPLFFIKATALDTAMDLEGNRRTIEDWSPYQAMFGTGDKDMLAAVKPHLDAYLKTLPKGEEMAAQQELEKFPNGFDFPPCTDEFTKLLNELAVAITNDNQLKINWKNPEPATLELLNKVRKHYQPGIVKTGHHFNMNDFIKTHKICKQYRDPWNTEQLAFFSVNVIGFQERLLTAPYLQVACMGLDKHVNQKQPLVRSFEIKNYVTGKQIAVVPLLSENSSCRLGVGFLIDSYYGGAPGQGHVLQPGHPSLWLRGGAWRTMSSEHSRAFKTYAHTTETNCSIMCERLK